MNNFLVKIFISAIEKYIGKYAQKFKVEVNDEGELGFTITIKVFEPLNDVMKKAGSTLSGLIKKI